MPTLCPPTNETVHHLLQLCNTTQNIPYCWQEKTDGVDRFHPGVSLVSVSKQMSANFFEVWNLSFSMFPQCFPVCVHVCLLSSLVIERNDSH